MVFYTSVIWAFSLENLILLGDIEPICIGVASIM